VLQTILGTNKVTYNYIKELGYIDACEKSDLKKLDLKSVTTLFNKQSNLFLNTKIKIYS